MNAQQTRASLRALLARPVHGAALATGLSSWWAGRQKVRRVVMLHGVGPADELSPERLDHIVGWLSTRFQIVSLTDLLDGLVRGRPANGEVALTFDDGLRCQLQHAYPVLLRRSAPATFFICPGLVDSGRWLWNHEARTRLQRLDPAMLASNAAGWGAPRTDVEGVIAWMKTLDTARRAAVEMAIRGATPGFAPTDAERERYDVLTWQDVDRLDPHLVTIGSHTLLHPILPTLDDAALEHELRESRRLLEQRLGRSVDIFCYPSGSTDGRVRAAAARIYRYAVTTEDGTIGQGANLLALPRIPVSDRLAQLAWGMHRPRITGA